MRGFRYELQRVALVIKQEEIHRRYELPKFDVEQLEILRRFKLPSVAVVLKQSESHRHFYHPKVTVLVMQLPRHRYFELLRVAVVPKQSEKHRRLNLPEKSLRFELPGVAVVVVKESVSQLRFDLPDELQPRLNPP